MNMEEQAAELDVKVLDRALVPPVHTADVEVGVTEVMLTGPNHVARIGHSILIRLRQSAVPEGKEPRVAINTEEYDELRHPSEKPEVGVAIKIQGHLRETAVLIANVLKKLNWGNVALHDIPKSPRTLQLDAQCDVLDTKDPVELRKSTNSGVTVMPLDEKYLLKLFAMVIEETARVDEEEAQ